MGWICPCCNEENEDYSMFCLFCATPRPEEEQENTEPKKLKAKKELKPLKIENEITGETPELDDSRPAVSVDCEIGIGVEKTSENKDDEKVNDTDSFAGQCATDEKNVPVEESMPKKLAKGENAEEKEQKREKEVQSSEEYTPDVPARRERGKISEEQKEEKSELEELKYQATHDELTDVKNRKGFEEDIKNLDIYALVSFDVNNLKMANDKYGHQKGDLLLTTVVKELSKSFKSLYRVGGDEFIALVSGYRESDKSKLEKTLQKIDTTLQRRTAKSKDIIYEVAYGIAFSSEGNKEEVLNLADKRMYANKKMKKEAKEVPKRKVSKLSIPVFSRQMIEKETEELAKALDTDSESGLKDIRALHNELGQSVIENMCIVAIAINGYEIDAQEKMTPFVAETVGKCMIKAFGEKDSYRYSKDTFMVLLPKQTRVVADDKIHKFKEELRTAEIVSEENIKLSFAAGIVLGQKTTTAKGILEQVIHELDIDLNKKNMTTVTERLQSDEVYEPNHDGYYDDVKALPEDYQKELAVETIKRAVLLVIVATVAVVLFEMLI